jgi:hypothetical protein
VIHPSPCTDKKENKISLIYEEIQMGSGAKSNMRKGFIHRKKMFTSFQSPAGMSPIKLPLGRNNSVLTSLFPPRESLVVTSRLGTGNSRTFFYGVVYEEMHNF